MNERDRLQADLHHDPAIPHGPKYDRCYPIADRLIALGWTRRDLPPDWCGHKAAHDDAWLTMDNQQAEIARLRVMYAAQLNLTIEANAEIARLRAALADVTNELTAWETASITAQGHG